MELTEEAKKIIVQMEWIERAIPKLPLLSENKSNLLEANYKLSAQLEDEINKN